jgi:hypothetical protein
MFNIKKITNFKKNIASSSTNNNSDSSNSSTNTIKNKFTQYYMKFDKLPSQYTIIENLDGIVEDIFNDKKTSDDMVLSILFQICFTLTILQNKFSFTHNDLHTRNIMFKNSNIRYLYYKYQTKYFKIPTFGKIIKIIDFGRSIYTYKKYTYFNDVFNKHGDASGQYTYPSVYKKKNKIVKPNYSFDLSRLSVSILEDRQKNFGEGVMNLLYEWVMDKNGKDIRRYEEFDLYKAIARKINNAIPSEQLLKPIFDRFSIKKFHIPRNSIIYFIGDSNLRE